MLWQPWALGYWSSQVYLMAPSTRYWGDRCPGPGMMSCLGRVLSAHLGQLVIDLKKVLGPCHVLISPNITRNFLVGLLHL